MIIFMGVAGSGKSKQGKLLADTYGLPWLSTGEFLRMLVSGQQRKDMLAGKLLDDQHIISLVQKMFAIVDTDNEFIIDGFPRTAAQADWLINHAKHGQLKINAVIHLKASQQSVRKRLISRGRQDDNHEALSERFHEYEETTLPILEQFKSSGIDVFDIDGEKSPEAVHTQITLALKGII